MNTFTAICVGLIIGFAFAIVLAIPTMILWNWLMVSIFGLKAIGVLEALGLNMLSSIFFRSNVTVSRE
jgi:hypothetical protein